MQFVYLHIALFTIWMLFIEKSPWPTLTLIVSLEAIFLSTFVMISQNRADEKRQVVAAQEWKSVQLEEAERGAAAPVASDPDAHERDPSADRGARRRIRLGHEPRIDALTELRPAAPSIRIGGGTRGTRSRRAGAGASTTPGDTEASPRGRTPRDAGQRERADEAGLNEPQPAGREGNLGEELRRRVGEDHERWAGCCPDGSERAQQGEVVEGGIAHGRYQGRPPPPTDRVHDEIAIGDELLGRHPPGDVGA